MAKPVLITRPMEDANSLASRVAYLGGDPVLCPLLTIHYLDAEVDLAGVQGLLFTSANGVRAFARLNDNRQLPAFAVGDATAREAREAGFATVHTAAGDVDALARLVVETCKPQDGDLFHSAGSKLAGDLAGLLGASGFVTRRRVTYESIAAEDLPESATVALQGDGPATVLLYSPRTAASFVELTERAGLHERLRHATALCLSHAVAEKIAPYQWAEVVVADKPEQDSLLGQLERILANEMTDDKNQDARNENEQGQEDHLTDAVDAEALIEAFGGIRPMAHKLDVAVSTVQGWKLRNHIPPARLAEIEQAAAENHIDMTDIIRKAPEDVTSEETEPAETQSAPDSPESVQAEPANTPSPEPAAATPPPAAPTRESSGNKVAWAALIASLALGSALVLQPYWAPTVNQKIHPALEKIAPKYFAAKTDDTGLQGEIDSLRSQIDGLAGTVSALEAPTGNGGMASSEAEFASLRQQIFELQQRFGRLESQPVSGSAPADLSPIEARITQLEAEKANLVTRMVETQEALQKALDAQGLEAGTLAARVSGIASRLQAVETLTQDMANQPGTRNQKEIALVVAAGQLEALALNGLKYRDALTTFQALAQDMPGLDDAIANLAKAAETGAATRTELLRHFQVIAAKIDKPIKGTAEGDWMDATLANISGLVSIRRTGAEPDLPPMSRAETALSRDDLIGAIEALVPLEADRPDIADWLTAARQRLAVEQALTAIRNDTAKRLSLASVTPESTLTRAAEDKPDDNQADTTGSSNEAGQ